jgi:predicted dehydrogenase
MLKVGIIGLGPAWESRYYPALCKLRDRICPTAVYDAVQTRAEAVAHELQAQRVDGIYALISRRDVEAVLLFDANWHAEIPLHFACQHLKPVFIAGSLGDNVPHIQELQHYAANHGLSLMPELSRRYTPATLRFRELLATSLGRVRRLRLELTLPTAAAHPLVPGQSNELDLLVGLVDWCRCVIGLQPQSISSRIVLPATSQRATITRIREVDLIFKRSATDGELGRAEIRLRIPGAQVSPTESDMTLQCQADCALGHATLTGSDQLIWRAGNTHHQESLSTERSEVELMLDHFTRRILGGLIPIPNLDDVCQSLAWVQAVSRPSGEETTAACLLPGRNC